MGGVTSPLSFPYPTGTDRVMDGDNAMQALAEKIDDYLAGADGNIPPSAGFVGQGVARRRGGMVSITLNFTSTVVTVNSSVLGIIPVGFRPVVDGYGVWVNSGSGTPQVLGITASNGAIVEVIGRPSNSGTLGTCTFPMAY